MLTKVTARIRGYFSGNYPENRENEQLIINSRGDLSVVQGLPELAEVNRLGYSWQVANTTGVAAATALPTTTGGLSLYNGEPGGGRSYVIDSFGSWEGVIDATQADTSAIFACNNVGTVAAPTGGTALTPSTAAKSLSGRKAYGGRALMMTLATNVSSDGWFPHGAEGVSQLAAAAGAIWKVNEVKIRGGYIVQPGGMFNIAVVKVAAAALQQFYFIRWHEVQLIVQP